MFRFWLRHFWCTYTLTITTIAYFHIQIDSIHCDTHHVAYRKDVP
jgi:hypothetical protein